MKYKWFITGTDTDVGKTVAGCALLHAACQAGFCTAGYKPVASGSVLTPEGIRNSDALALQRAASLALPYEVVNPLVFMEPTSPHIISAHEGQPIDFRVMSRGLQSLYEQADWVQVEGAGGWLTPLSTNRSFADWVEAEQLPVILVVGMKLGCINHALLTAQAVRARGLSLRGWIANGIMPAGRWHEAYMDTLRQHLGAPLLGELPFLSDPEQDVERGDFLDLSALI